MRIVNFREIRYLSPCFAILWRIKYDDNTEDKGRGWLAILIERTENGTWECSMDTSYEYGSGEFTGKIQ